MLYKFTYLFAYSFGKNVQENACFCEPLYNLISQQLSQMQRHI